MKMHTPRLFQGQTVERSFGWKGGALYRRTEDRSDGTVTWHVASSPDCERLASLTDDPGAWDIPPPGIEWHPVPEPD